MRTAALQPNRNSPPACCDQPPGDEPVELPERPKAGGWLALAAAVLIAAGWGCTDDDASSTGGNGATGNAATGAAPATGGTSSIGGTSGASASGGATGSGGNPGAAGGSADDFLVVGYTPSWAGSANDVRYDQLTHVNYAFALPNADGTLKPVENEAKLDAIVTSGHAQGVEVVLSIGGWNGGDDSAFTTLAATSATRQTFAEAVHSYVTEHDLDGVDIDWEYPEAADAANYTALIAEFSARLHPEGKIVTAAVSASDWGASGIVADVFPYFDHLLIMAYDGGTSTTAPPAGDPSTHSPLSFAESALAYWLDQKGLPRDKAVLGVPFYAHPGWKPYREIVALDPAAAQQDTWDGYHYNGIPTMHAKTQLAMERASGIMIWELTQDAQGELSLLSAIGDVAHGG